MSTLKVNSIQNTVGVDLLTPIQSGRAKAWVNFDGTFGSSPFTVSNGGIRDAFNVTSVTDNGTGDYTITFDNAMPNANYCVTGSLKEHDSTANTFVHFFVGRKQTLANSVTTTFVRVHAVGNNGNSTYDVVMFSVAIFGD